MEPLTRHLRDGVQKDDVSCPMAVFMDDAGACGGFLLLQQAISDLQEAHKQKRMQGAGIMLVTLDHPASAYLGSDQQQGVHVVDLHDDPWGWASNTTVISCSSSPEEGTPTMGLGQLWTVLTRGVGQPLFTTDPSVGGGSSSGAPKPVNSPPSAEPDQHSPAAGNTPTLCIIIDSISSLFHRYSTPAVLRLLERLRHHPGVSSILGLLHADLHAPQVSHAIEHMSTCCAQLLPVTRLQQEAVKQQLAKVPSGRLQMSFKRRTGRVKVEQRLYSLTHQTSGSSSVEVLSMTVGMDLATQALLATGLLSSQGGTTSTPPTQPTLLAAEAAAATAGAVASAAVGSNARSAAAAGSSGPQLASPAVLPLGGRAAGGVGVETTAELGAALAGGMKLGLTDQEREAKQRVVLPWAHQGTSAAYQTDDFKSYLPVEAGGAPRDGKLGHILYVRDSDNESVDSDEDPDNDLDI